MEFRVGSEEEQHYINTIIQKQIYIKQKEQIKQNPKNKDPNEYKYLQYLIFKYCCIPNAAL
jgi:hypothetical protein